MIHILGQKSVNSAQALHIRVNGHVQGVGYRAWAVSQARRLRLAGWVRNCADGSVEIFAEGDAESLDSFVEMLKEGNGYSSVRTLTVDPAKPQGYGDFSVEF